MSLIAEAFVRMRPDFTGFRAEFATKLQAELAGIKAAVPAAATIVPVRTQIVSDVAGASAATRQASQVARVAATEQAAADRVAITQSKELARAEALQAAATAKVAAASEAGAAATTELAAAQRVATASSAAVTAAERAHAVALRLENAELVQATATTVLKAKAQEEAAIAAVATTRSETLHATQLATVSRGAGATALSFIGLRGATLAASGAFLAGAAAAALLFKSVSSAVSFERELNVLQATSHATATEMQQVAEAARRLGADITLPAVSAADAAVAMTELSKAGLSVQDSIAGARGVLQLATAAQLDNVAATELAANALNAFGLAGDQAGRVADVLTNAANAAQGSIADFGQALQQSAAVGRQVGLTLEDTTAILTLLAQAGLRGSDAGTSLRVALIKLVAPTQQAKALIEDLGLTIRDAQGNVRPDIFAQFGEATKALGPAFRDVAAQAIFGQDAIRAVAIAARAGAGGLKEVQDQIRQQGSAADLAAARTKGLSGDMEQLKNSASNLGITIGEDLIPAVTAATKGFTFLVEKTQAAVNALGSAASFIADVFGGSGIDKAQQTLDRLGETLANVSGRKVDTQNLLALEDALQGVRIEAETADKAFLSSGKSAALFAETVRKSAAAQSQLDPVIAHNLELLAQFTAAVEHVPSSAEITVFLDNTKAKASLEDLLKTVSTIDAGAANDAEKAGERTGVAFAHGFENATPFIADIFGNTFLDALNQGVDKAKGKSKTELLSPEQIQRFGDRLRDQFSKVDLSGAAGENARNLSKALIEALRRQGPAGQAELRQLGRQLAHGLTLGITDEQRNTVAAANQAVTDAIEQGQKQVDDAVRQAKSNLGSIAQSLAGTVGQVLDSRAEAAIARLDQSPLAKEIKALTAELDKTNLKEQRAQLVFEIGQATDDATRRRAIFQLKEFDLSTKLDSDKKKLQSEKDNIQKTADAQKQAITRNLAAYADAFARGQITLAQFSGRVLARLNAQEEPFRNVGKLLGSAFKSSFDAQIQGLLDQAAALAGFQGRVAGGTTQIQPVSPLDALRTSQRAIADAQKNRDERLASIEAESRDLLKQINRALGGGKVTTRGGSGVAGVAAGVGGKIK